MNLDITMLTLVLSLSNITQVIALFVQWRSDKTYHGPRWWLLGTATTGLGFGAAYLRVFPQQVTFGVIASGSLFVAGALFLLTGTLRFFGQHERRGAIITCWVVFTVLDGYLTFSKQDMLIRRTMSYLVTATVFFIIARALQINKKRIVNTAENFLIIVFLFQASVLILGAWLTVMAPAEQSFLGVSASLLIPVLGTFITTNLWTFGFILLVNQRFGAENRETRENLELVFNTSPDAMILTRLTDGAFVRTNDGFSALTGYTRLEVLGKTVFQINLWKNPDDRQKLFTLLKETGVCENLEAVFQRKDGSHLIGMVSARLIDLQGTAHIVSVTHDITRRKQADEQLRASEEKFRGLLDCQESNIMMFDFDGVHHYVNQGGAASITTSGTARDVIGKRLHDLYPEHIADWQLEQIRRVFTSGQGFSGDFRTGTDSQSGWWHLNLQPIRDASGQVMQVMVNSLDISERKRAEHALHESEERTATILRLSPIVIGVSTLAEGRYTDVNDAFERVLGYSQAETLGRTSFDLNLWVDNDTRLNILREIQAHGRVENLEINLRRKSGEVFPALIFITPLTLHDTACLLTMMMDITERKQVEEQLRETRDALQTIFYSSPLAILTLDAEDRVTMWNPAAEAMFGWSDKQTLGKANPTVPENKSKEYNALRQAALNGMAFSNLDTLRLNKDGTQFPVSLSVAPLRGQQSQVIGGMHIIADITERKKLQEELRQQATTDELTRVSNRRYFIELARSEIKRAIRLKRPPAIALIDIDHFKQINDTYGHAAGDQALIAFTKICQKQIREIDVFARFGGDEFVLLLPETNQEQAYVVVERVRLALAKHPIDLDGKPVTITISAGIASLSDEDEPFDMLLSNADQALYRAKQTGRNNVVRYDTMRGD